MTDLRLGAHDTFDRVVIQLDGPDVPGWDVGYVDHAIGDPSGAAVEVAGDAVLQVLIHPVAYPEDGINPYDGPPTVRISGTEAIDEVVMSSIFEGQLQAFIGVRGGHRSFRVYGMSDPSRVVIEVLRTRPARPRRPCAAWPAAADPSGPPTGRRAGRPTPQR